jgi:hypothetical protein
LKTTSFFEIRDPCTQRRVATHKTGMPDYTSVKTSKLASQIVPQPVKEIPRILRDPKFHYSANNSPPLVSILGQINPISALLSDLF